MIFHSQTENPAVNTIFHREKNAVIYDARIIAQFNAILCRVIAK